MWRRTLLAAYLALLTGTATLLLAQDTGTDLQPVNPADSKTPAATSEKPAVTKPGNSENAHANQLAARIDQLHQQLAQLNKAVSELKQELAVLRQGLASVDKTVDELKKDVASVNTVLQQQMLAKRLDALELALSNLRDTLKQETDRLHAALAQSGKTEVRKAFSAPAPTGQVIIRNDWSFPVTVSVDGIAYTLQPGQEQRVVRAAGNFTYEVHGWQGPRTRTLTEGEQFLIRITYR